MTHEADSVLIGQFLKKFNSFGQCSWRIVSKQKIKIRLRGRQEPDQYSLVDCGKESRFYSYKEGKPWKGF